MGSILNIGTRALLANQLALQTAGNNIANVNTAGYSRQSVVLQSVEGQFSGSGYYGNGVTAATVLRKHDEFLTRQATLTGSVAAADAKRLERMQQLDDLFQGGPSGLGTAVGDMLNAFSDVASAPTSLSARTVALARTEEATARMRASAERLSGIGQAVSSELAAAVNDINSLAGRIAAVNKQIANDRGSGHEPNDLLDQRDQFIRDLNKLVQTTNIPAGDGSIGIFLGGSQPLVLGNSVSPVAVSTDEFNDPGKSKLTIQRSGLTSVLDEAALGGGSIAGLLRFQNTDLVEATNLLGRMALALGTKMNEQHRLGLDPSGAPGSNLFTMAALPNALPAPANLSAATVSVGVQAPPATGSTSLAASDYEMTFSSATAGTVKRLSDGTVTAFGTTPGVALVDGLVLQASAAASAGDRFLVTPYRKAAAAISTAFASPRDLAMAAPVAGSAGNSNTGSLALQSLLVKTPNINVSQIVTLTFTGAGTFDVTGTGTGNPAGLAYTPGQAISFNGWALQLNGVPKPGDSFVVAANTFPATTGGNAEAMLALRDTPMFDGAPTTDGYAALLSQIGVRVQSAGFSAEISKSIASSVEADRSAVSGVNLDEEAAKLLQFQQAYQASAKILQVSQTIFDSLLQNLRQ